MNSVFNTLIMSVCGVFKWVPFTSDWVLESLQPRGKVRPGDTDLGVISVVRPMRVDEIIQGKRNGKN